MANDVYQNASKCHDPTAGEAIKNADNSNGAPMSENEARVRRLIRLIVGICELAGFRWVGWVDVVDEQTGIRHKRKIKMDRKGGSGNGKGWTISQQLLPVQRAEEPASGD